MQHPAIQPISFSSSFKCFLVIFQALSLSLSAKITKLPSFLVTLQALSLSLSFLPKSPNLLHNETANHTCNATATYSHMQLSRCHLFSTLTTTTRNPIAYICQIYHTAMGHRYFNLAMTCDICLRYAHASHKSASAFRFPTL